MEKNTSVMVSVGKADNGRPVCRPLKPQAYFATYNNAFAALVDYNRNPYDLEPAITAKELCKDIQAEWRGNKGNPDS